MSTDGRRREALRQQMMLRALWRDNTVAAVQGWLREDAARAQRGLEAYAATARGNAQRALRSSFPTVVALLGDETFDLVARAYWLARPPARGDLAWLGESFPAVLADDPQLADVPYLADCARLDWRVDRAERAADAPARPESLLLMQQRPPASLRLQLASGAALLHSRWPVATIHAAHEHVGAGDPFAAARAALASGHGEHVFVWRQGFKGRVAAIDAATHRFIEALLRPASLAEALDQAGDGFGFEPWLLRALSEGWLLAVVDGAAATPPPLPT